MPARFTGIALLSLALVSCADPPRTTRMTIDDFQEMAGVMAESLMHSDALAQRGPASPLWVVSMEKVRNLSSDVMTEAEQWAIMADLRATTPLQALWDQKNVRFVMPPERLKSLRDSDTFSADEQKPQRRDPTHTLTATLRSVTRADLESRADVYACEFQLLDLHTGEPMWSDQFEVKREALGHVWD